MVTRSPGTSRGPTTRPSLRPFFRACTASGRSERNRGERANSLRRPKSISVMTGLLLLISRLLIEGVRSDRSEVPDRRRGAGTFGLTGSAAGSPRTRSGYELGLSIPEYRSRRRRAPPALPARSPSGQAPSDGLAELARRLAHRGVEVTVHRFDDHVGPPPEPHDDPARLI